MSRKLKTLLLFAAMTVAAIGFGADNNTIVRFWPRLENANMVANLEQLAFLEVIPAPNLGTIERVDINLPANVEIIGIPQAWVNPDKPSIYALPFPELTAYPTSIVQDGNKVTMTFGRDAFTHQPQNWLPMVVRVGDVKPGKYPMHITIFGEKMKTTVISRLVIWPELSGEQSKKPLVIWNFQGLEEQYLPTYMNALVKAGANRFYEMREEIPGRKSVVDFQDEFNTIHGTAFFGERIGAYFEKNGLPEELAVRDDIVYDNAWLLDHPEVMEVFLKHYIDFLTTGKKFDVVIYDAERGAFKGEKIVGDLTGYSLNKFGELYNVPQEKRNPEDIAKEYADEWIKYNCDQSLALATLANKVVKEKFPGMTFEVYSGYEYDDGVYKDTTCRSYAVDWKSMANSGMDAAGTGYFGDLALLRHTANTTRGKADLLPAEMYMEGFLTQGVPVPRLEVKVFAMRLISAFLATGGNGIHIWYGAVLDGGALAAIDIYNRFVNLTADFIDSAEEVQLDARISPAQNQGNVYAYRNSDGETLVIILNPTDKNANIRIAFTAEMQSMTDLATGEVCGKGRSLTVKLEPYSYKAVVVK